MSARRCLRRSCDRGRAQGQVFCGVCWAGLPQDLRDEFYATRAHSNERRAMLLKVIRWAQENLP